MLFDKIYEVPQYINILREMLPDFYINYDINYIYFYFFTNNFKIIDNKIEISNILINKEISNIINVNGIYTKFFTNIKYFIYLSSKYFITNDHDNIRYNPKILTINEFVIKNIIE